MIFGKTRVPSEKFTSPTSRHYRTDETRCVIQTRIVTGERRKETRCNDTLEGLKVRPENKEPR